MADINVSAALTEMGIEISRKQIPVDCPACGKSKRMLKCYIGAQNGLWNCFSCGEKGDIYKFKSLREGISYEQAKTAIKTHQEGMPVASPKETESLFKEKPHADARATDKTLRKFASHLPLTKRHYQMLKERGFSDSAIEFYEFFSFPEQENMSYNERQTLNNLPSLLKNEGCQLDGVEPFYPNPSKDHEFSINWPKIGSGKTWHTGGIGIPQKSFSGAWHGIQIRFDDEYIEDIKVKEGEEKVPKCKWLTSSNKEGGVSPDTSVHYATHFKDGKAVLGKKLLITEGGMKADLIHDLQRSWPIISIAGVNATKGFNSTLSLLKTNGVTDIIDCFDMDYVTNEKVAAARERLKQMIIKAGLKYHLAEWSTKTEDGTDCLKGLDDFLAYRKKGIKRS